MRVTLCWGLQRLDLDVADDRYIALRRRAPAEPLRDLGAAVGEALENPLDFPPLRLALTPDDHVAVFVDEELPHITELLVPLLEHVRTAGVAPSAIKLLCLPPSTGQPWADKLPEEFREVQVEIHDPRERRKLSYLATTRHGRRIYLNRTSVDADQLVLLTGRWYDPLLGIGGAEASLFPTLSDEATGQELYKSLSAEAPDDRVWPLRQEAAEVAWLLGAPFLVQIIEGPGDDIVGVLAGPVESTKEGQRMLNEHRRVEVEERADLVVAGISGDPAQHGFGAIARAFLCASRVVKPGGRIVVLSDARPPLGPSASVMRRSEDPAEALRLLREEKARDIGAGFSWASAALTAQLYLLSQLPAETVEEMFAIPLQQIADAQRLVASAESCIVLPDAHKMLAIVKE